MCSPSIEGKLKKWNEQKQWIASRSTPSIDSGNPVEGLNIIFVLILMIILCMQKDVVVIHWCWYKISGKASNHQMYHHLSALPTFHQNCWGDMAIWQTISIVFLLQPCEVLKWSICHFQIICFIFICNLNVSSKWIRKNSPICNWCIYICNLHQ